MSALLLNDPVLPGYLLPVLAVCVVLLILLLIFVAPIIARNSLKKNGELANATILEVKTGRGTLYSGDEYNHTVVAQKLILKLEVHPSSGAAYIAEDRFMAKVLDMMKLKPGCNIQVRVDRNKPQRVVCLPETISATADAPIQARAGLAIADLMASAKSGKINPEDVAKAMQAHGVRIHPAAQSDDPKTALERLKEMREAGLITPQDYEAKKAEILARM